MRHAKIFAFPTEFFCFFFFVRSAGSEQGCGKLLVEPEGDRSLKKIAALSGEGLGLALMWRRLPKKRGTRKG